MSQTQCDRLHRYNGSTREKLQQIDNKDRYELYLKTYEKK